MSSGTAPPSGKPAFPKEQVLASAGTGKTFTISSRVIRLLSLGVSSDALLASTFTRKAAGEILNRVLKRLAHAALDDKKAHELVEEAGIQEVPGEDPPDARFFLGILRSLVQDLHRLNIGTLDAFFIRVARAFPSELGLSQEWQIAAPRDPPPGGGWGGRPLATPVRHGDASGNLAWGER
jgi:ATP-dependent exoDNAse (exonuclease V) beta subunit